MCVTLAAWTSTTNASILCIFFGHGWRRQDHILVLVREPGWTLMNFVNTILKFHNWNDYIMHLFWPSLVKARKLLNMPLTFSAYTTDWSQRGNAKWGENFGFFVPELETLQLVRKYYASFLAMVGEGKKTTEYAPHVFSIHHILVSTRKRKVWRKVIVTQHQPRLLVFPSE